MMLYVCILGTLFYAVVHGRRKSLGANRPQAISTLFALFVVMLCLLLFREAPGNGTVFARLNYMALGVIWTLLGVKFTDKEIKTFEGWQLDWLAYPAASFLFASLSMGYPAGVIAAALTLSTALAIVRGTRTDQGLRVIVGQTQTTVSALISVALLSLSVMFLVDLGEMSALAQFFAGIFCALYYWAVLIVARFGALAANPGPASHRVMAEDEA